MATQPHRFERVSEPQPEEYGPRAPRIKDQKIVSSGPLGSPLNKAVHHEYIPHGSEWAKDLIKRIPSWGMPIVLQFLESVPSEHVQQAAKIFTDLAEGIKDSPESKTEIRRIIDEVKSRMVH